MGANTNIFLNEHSFRIRSVQEKRLNKTPARGMLAIGGVRRLWR